MNINELINIATNSPNTFTWSNTTSAYSVSIVNNTNGKRLTISKSLARELSITGEIYILPIVEKGVILISGVKFSPAAQSCSVRGTDKKICYNADLVKKLSDNFNLDFSEVTSKSFNDITVEKFEECYVATVKLNNMAEV